MGSPLFTVTHDPVDLAALITLVTHQVDGAPVVAGAVVSFLGLVRGENLGKRVVHLEYEAYAPLAVKAFARIAAEAQGRWARRTGGGASPLGDTAGWRPQRRDRRGIAPSSRGVRHVPVYDRAHQADRTDLEARILRGRRRLDRGRDHRSGR